MINSINGTTKKDKPIGLLYAKEAHYLLVSAPLLRVL